MIRCLKNCDTTGYANTIRLRVAYFGLVTTVTIASLILGGCLQLFFAILGADAPLEGYEKILVICAAPLLFWVGSILADEAVDLVLDAIGDPPLDNFRAVIAAALNLHSTKKSDLFMVITLEGIPLATAIFLCIKHNLYTITEFATSYMAGAVIWMTAATSIQVVCRLVVSASEEKRMVYFLLLRKMLLCDFLDDINDDEESDQSDEDEEEKSDDSDEDGDAPRVKRPNGKLSRRMPKKMRTKFDNHDEPQPLKALGVIVLTLMILALTASFLTEYSAVCIIIVSLSLMALSFATHLVIPELLGPTYYIMLGLFIVLAFSLTGMTTTHIMDATDSEAKTIPVLTPPAVAGSYGPQSVDDIYPVCMMRWGGPGVTEDKLKLNVIDMASFSEAIYHMDNTSVIQVVNSFTQGTALEGVKLQYLEDQRTVGRWGIFDIDQSRLTVFAVRGTTTGDDAMADADMFATIEIMQFADNFIPLLRIIPTKLIRELVASIVLRKLFQKPRIYDEVLAAAKAAKAEAEAKGHQMVVTGHSLGGVLAALVGAVTESPTVAISPPGEYYTLDRFNIKQPLFERNVVVVKPNKDVVPQVDEQIGMVQKIDCAVSALGCHSIVRTTCELVRTWR
eukprot:TRINITY_DN1079_c0_g1_i2.p1 TRINITY_DN1079_c0_g1~~TRINITY_DN1079_c0_g1_i2.p1  ORF type:complete len:638 (-),score=165.83 TRINITY_DN1079_c0_g1_i2:381-2243(-)